MNICTLLRTQLEYSAWASLKLVEAAAQLSPEQLTRDFSTADRSVLGTLVHVYAADRVWLGRIRGNPPAAFLNPEADMHLTVLQNDWPALHQRWREWAASIDDQAAAATFAYKDLKGNSYETPLWQSVLHVVNHATHHRGQTVGFMRAMGQTPPWIDLIAYFRTQ